LHKPLRLLGAQMYNFSPTKTVVILGIMMTYFVSTCVFAGPPGSDQGGGTAEYNAKRALQRLILDDGYNLKASMRNYLNTININKISDSVVMATLNKIGKAAMISDINQSRYRIETGAREAYIPSLGSKSGIKVQPAATTDFALAADVKFDLDLLYNEIKNLPEEDQMIAVASLALHEHIHHFQTKPGASLSSEPQLLERESEAYEFSGYVLVTAKFAQVPLLTWTTSSGPAHASPTCKANNPAVTANCSRVNNKLILRNIKFHMEGKLYGITYDPSMQDFASANALCKFFGASTEEDYSYGLSSTYPNDVVLDYKGGFLTLVNAQYSYNLVTCNMD
jgi:hypothetical protein